VKNQCWLLMAKCRGEKMDERGWLTPLPLEVETRVKEFYRVNPAFGERGDSFRAVFQASIFVEKPEALELFFEVLVEIGERKLGVKELTLDFASGRVTELANTGDWGSFEEDDLIELRKLARAVVNIIEAYEVWG
jgi:hypothetical protein